MRRAQHGHRGPRYERPKPHGCTGLQPLPPRLQFTLHERARHVRALSTRAPSTAAEGLQGACRWSVAPGGHLRVLPRRVEVRLDGADPGRDSQDRKKNRRTAWHSSTCSSALGGSFSAAVYVYRVFLVQLQILQRLRLQLLLARHTFNLRCSGGWKNAMSKTTGQVDPGDRSISAHDRADAQVREHAGGCGRKNACAASRRRPVWCGDAPWQGTGGGW